MQDFRVPLIARALADCKIGRLNGIWLTLSMTFSNEFGQSIAKHTKMRSVSG